MPRRGERACFRLAVAHDAGGDEIGIVEHHAVGVRQAVSELTAFVDRSGSLRCHVAADVAGEGELLEELPQALEVLALVGIDLGIGTFQIGGPEYSGCAMTRARDEDDVEVVTKDEPVQVNPDERQRRTGPPMAQQPGLCVLRLQRRSQQRIVLQVDHPHRQVVAGTPVRIDQRQLPGGQRRDRLPIRFQVRAQVVVHGLFSRVLMAIHHAC